MAALATIADLAYSTPDGRPLVRALSFNVSPGQIVAVTGPNGIGKSTLLRVLLGERPPSSGSVQLAVDRRDVAYLSQLHNREFHIPLTLADVLSFATHGRLDSESAVAVGLLTREQLSIAWNSASGGERQKTLLTQVFLGRPRLLILDEPMNHLDASGRRQLQEALARFTTGGEHAAIMVCHERSLGHDGWTDTAVIDLRRFS
jgi:ATPase subunit of ABC transporter with duplicated ATPase domains